MAIDSQIPSDLMSSSQLHESTSISIIMLLATVLFILLITAFVTCITRKNRAAQTVESEVVSESVRRAFNKDKPPDYDTAVKMKEREELELPSYSQAVSDMSGDTRVEDNNSKTSRPDHLPD